MEAKFSATEMQMYAQGFADGFRKAEKKGEKAVLDVQDIMARYQCGQNRARAIIQAVRHTCNGGKTGAAGSVLRSELEYWESFPEKIFKARL